MTAGQDQPGAGAAVAIVLTPIPRARFVAALCGLHKVAGTVLETSGGPIVVLDDAAVEAAEQAARTLSGFLKGAPFLLALARDGEVQVQEWRAGTIASRPAPGLALAESPGVVTTLLTGAQTIDQVAETHEDKVHDTRMNRFSAYRELLKETKALRREQKG
ncbi:hypothetical protein [Demequina mangrovi]|uniref:Uncharacterized protein n=1 Tax=Demequina mangrovi TaxID=1043493 RepID=A0A1H6Z4X5_9MICO|nr:hypothetical protein [Demequina mangrovi]SEJ46457.1 hypothetical protein SAMN05421637_1875 [Demequina mangrovi]